MTANLKTQIAFHDAKKPESGLAPKEMYGTLRIYDLNKNSHSRMVEDRDGKSNPTTHAEEKLVKNLKQFWKSGELQNAKAIFYMSSSPCQSCTSNVKQIYDDIKKLVCPKGTLFLVFSFSQYYTGKVATKGATKGKPWGSEEEARIAYRAKTEIIEIKKQFDPGKSDRSKSTITFLLMEGTTIKERIGSSDAVTS